MTSQPGWHPDPLPPAPGQPPQLRYWDGTRWTEHVAPAQPPAPTPQDGAPPAYQGTYGTAYAPAYGAAYAAIPGRAGATTPDGVPLAGWWQRVLALILDSIIVGIIGALVALPWLRDLVGIWNDWFDEVLRSADAGDSTVDTNQLQSDMARPLAIVTVINLGLGLAYHVGFLMWKQATPGKLVLGLRVRLRERPGPMPLGTVLLRWLGQFGPGILGLVPVVGTLSSLYSVLDYLWPLWDDKLQAIHDKIAKTNVVRTR